MKLSQDLKPVSYIKNNMAEVLRKLNENQGTMIITQNGEARAALIDIKAYEDLQETLAMLEMIAQGNKNLTEGRYRPAEQVLKDFEPRIEKDFSWCLIQVGQFEHRQIIEKKYRIIYQIAKPNIFIFGIIHGNRDISEVLRQRILQ